MGCDLRQFTLEVWESRWFYTFITLWLVLYTAAGFLWKVWTGINALKRLPGAFQPPARIVSHLHIYFLLLPLKDKADRLKPPLLVNSSSQFGWEEWTARTSQCSCLSAHQLPSASVTMLPLWILHVMLFCVESPPYAILSWVTWDPTDFIWNCMTPSQSFENLKHGSL